MFFLSQEIFSNFLKFSFYHHLFIEFLLFVHTDHDFLIEKPLLIFKLFLKSILLFLSNKFVFWQTFINITNINIKQYGWYNSTQCRMRIPRLGLNPSECQIPCDVDLGQVNFTIASLLWPPSRLAACGIIVD